jgi:hypothetical protein
MWLCALSEPCYFPSILFCGQDRSFEIAEFFSQENDQNWCIFVYLLLNAFRHYLSFTFISDEFLLAATIWQIKVFHLNTLTLILQKYR